jgi:uncharacterized protein (DUF1810 family)
MASTIIGNDLIDTHNLERFVRAQNSVYEQVRSELREGSKRGHWMWFIFPQIKGLGRSDMATKFAISSRAEAEAYLGHPLLGARLKECTQLVVLVEGKLIDDIFGYPDNLKFWSSMTLFAQVTSDNHTFKDALQKYFGGKLDQSTLEHL